MAVGQSFRTYRTGDPITGTLIANPTPAQYGFENCGDGWFSGSAYTISSWVRFDIDRMPRSITAKNMHTKGGEIYMCFASSSNALEGYHYWPIECSGTFTTYAPTQRVYFYEPGVGPGRVHISCELVPTVSGSYILTGSGVDELYVSGVGGF